MEDFVQDLNDSAMDADYHESLMVDTQKTESTEVSDSEMEENDLDIPTQTVAFDLPVGRRRVIRPVIPDEGFIGPNGLISSILREKNPEEAYMMEVRDYDLDIRTMLSASRGPNTLAKAVLSFERDNYGLPATELQLSEQIVTRIFTKMDPAHLEAHILGNIVERFINGELRSSIKAGAKAPAIYVVTIAKEDGRGPSVPEAQEIVTHLRTYLDASKRVKGIGAQQCDCIHRHMTAKAKEGDQVPYSKWKRIHLLEIFTLGFANRLASAQQAGKSIAPPAYVGWSGQPQKRQAQHFGGGTSHILNAYLSVCQHVFPGAFRVHFTNLYFPTELDEVSWAELALTRVASLHIGSGMLNGCPPGRNNSVDERTVREIEASRQLQVDHIVHTYTARMPAMELQSEKIYQQLLQQLAGERERQQQTAALTSKIRELEAKLESNQKVVPLVGRRLVRKASMSIEL